MERDGFSFGVPPSLGVEPSWSQAREFAEMLHGAGFSMVIPFKTYRDLEQALLGGEVDAAWSPPLACARVEDAGGTIALRGIREGSVTYRSAIVNRKRDLLELDSLRESLFRPRVAWVDESSIAGYRLPLAFLRKQGIDPAATFIEQRFLGSYSACIEALGDYRTDLTALFVGPKGLESRWGGRGMGLRVLALTDESSNDGVAISPNLDTDRARDVIDRLQSLADHPKLGPQFAAAFSFEGFDRPPAKTYVPLLSLLSPSE